VRFLDRRAHIALDRSIDQLLALSRNHEEAGDSDRAVVELDSAIHLCPPHSPHYRELLERLRFKRQALVRRGVAAVLERLRRHETGPFPLGDWLNLQDRAAMDPDLAPLRNEVATKLKMKLAQTVESDLASARSAVSIGTGGEALDKCQALAPLAAHLPEPNRGRLLSEAGKIVLGLVDREGILLDPPQGHFLNGSMARYSSQMIPKLVQGLKSKGYVPQPDSSPWRDTWSSAPYRLSLEVSEQQEGNYMASENRPTRIDARLKLFKSGIEIWNSTFKARTRVPLPNLPGYFSARVALSPARIEEFERLLYEDARGQIDEKLTLALPQIPECGQATLRESSYQHAAGLTR
jgi:hypothetical protein